MSNYTVFSKMKTSRTVLAMITNFIIWVLFFQLFKPSLFTPRSSQPCQMLLFKTLYIYWWFVQMQIVLHTHKVDPQKSNRFLKGNKKASIDWTALSIEVKENALCILVGEKGNCCTVLLSVYFMAAFFKAREFSIVGCTEKIDFLKNAWLLFLWLQQSNKRDSVTRWIFCWRPRHFNQYYLCMRWWFSRSFRCFSQPYKIKNYYF